MHALAADIALGLFHFDKKIKLDCVIHEGYACTSYRRIQPKRKTFFLF